MEEGFSIVKRGYDPDEVDRYIGEVESVLQSYKLKDAAIKNAIISAEITAEKIIKSAEDEAERIRDEAIAFLDSLLAEINAHRNYINSFRQEYGDMIRKYLGHFDEEDIIKRLSSADTVEDYLAEIRRDAIARASGEF